MLRAKAGWYSRGYLPHFDGGAGAPASLRAVRAHLARSFQRFRNLALLKGHSTGFSHSLALTGLFSMYAKTFV